MVFCSSLLEYNSRLCRHFGACGGCIRQDLPFDFYKKWKIEQVKTLFKEAHIDFPLKGMFFSSPGDRRRVVLTVREKNQQQAIGFHQRATHRIITIENCLVMHPELLKKMPALKEVALLLKGYNKFFHLCIKLELIRFL